MRTEVLCIYVLRVASGPRVKLASCKSALNPPVVCSTDRSKAVVPVLVLLLIRGKILNWIKEFLSAREQRVIVNGSQSSWKDVTSGIPQGSVLGPVLFLVFINDLPDVIEMLIKLFADDAKIYAVVSNQIVETRVQNSLNCAANWAKIWRMLFNIIKCHHLHIGKHHDRGIKYTMSSNNQEIELEKVDSEKDLGIIIDKNLTFRNHINSKVNIANRNLGIIFRTFTFIDEEIFLNLYKSIVRPHVEYATPIWSPLYKKENYYRKHPAACDKVSRFVQKLILPRKAA